MKHEWNWSDIVNPTLVERALEEKARREEARKRAAARGPANDVFAAHYVGHVVSARQPEAA